MLYQERNLLLRRLRVSIPYGSINAKMLTDLFSVLRQFQFLTVQLMQRNTSVYFCLFRVSIPYGSINASFQRQKVAEPSRVSIPYGSINAFEKFSITPLMLVSIPYGSINALKMDVGSESEGFYVSIPYGSINAFHIHHSRAERARFQFLTVQLMLPGAGHRRRDRELFQFLTVQLMQ